MAFPPSAGPHIPLHPHFNACINNKAAAIITSHQETVAPTMLGQMVTIKITKAIMISVHLQLHPNLLHLLPLKLVLLLFNSFGFSSFLSNNKIAIKKKR
jgi:hypothetical protein